MKSIHESYSPHKLEKNVLQFWSKNSFFQADEGSQKPSFCIILPPPNITGRVHIGHALNSSLQDVLIRWKRMLGFNTLWLPGTDHAGIATQVQVEKELAKKNLNKKQLGRNKFLEEVWKWKAKYGTYIIEQMKTLGFSCDWSRHTFTLDKSVSQAVRKVFVELYKKKRIYKGLKLINWSTVLESAISDLEVEFKEVKGSLWFISYPLVVEKGALVVATTRPETLLGDVALAVNPKDLRYEKFIGKKVKLPLVDREIPIISDESVNREFGTGVVKITPAHDFNDYEMGKRHHLEPINLLCKDGRLNENGLQYQGLKVIEARRRVVEDLNKGSFLVKEVSHKHSVGHCIRSGCVVEPFLSEQWFLKMEDMAIPAKQVVESETILFQPSLWLKTYLHWMNHIQDWCISRQLWWGHQIPAWSCQSCEHLNVSENKVLKCESCESEDLQQDPDVLDTWFSSALWPFSTLGWPEKESSLQEKFFPTDVLVTGHDIIFFWVARMIMMSLEFKKEVPFRKVFFHGVVRDHQGKKMSKSLGNSIDPLDVAKEFGSDALRFTLLSQSVAKDTRFSLKNVEKSRNFMNKVWNASRFTFNLLESFSVKKLSEPIDIKGLELFDHWILKKISEAQEKINQYLKENNFHEAHHEIYHFVWSCFCDWYLEMSKPFFYTKSSGKLTESHKVLFQTFEKTLKLLHPFAPFLTEELFQGIYNEEKTTSITISEFPHSKIDYESSSFNQVELMIKVISGFRNFKAENSIPPHQKMTGYINVKERESDFRTPLTKMIIEKLSGLRELIFVKPTHKDKDGTSYFVINDSITLIFDLNEGVDKEKEIERLNKSLSKLEKELGSLSRRLQNPDFIKKAPQSVVKRTETEFQSLNSRQKELKESLSKLCDKGQKDL